jgi:hypothetical protein
MSQVGIGVLLGSSVSESQPERGARVKTVDLAQPDP